MQRTAYPGLALTLALAACASFLTPLASDAHLSVIRQGFEAYGFPDPGDLHGIALATGDFNGDGFQDLATGASGEGFPDTQSTGMVVINYGSEQGLTHAGSVPHTYLEFGFPLASNTLFGGTLLAVNMDGDAWDDLVVSATGFTVSGQQNAGRIFIWRGSPTGLVPWVTYSETDVNGFPQELDRFGTSLAAADFDGDGAQDLAVGSPGWDGSEGTVFLLHGSVTGGSGPVQVIKPAQFGEQNQVGDGFGWSLATGNVLGSGAPDLVIGAPYRDVFSSPSGGICYVLRGQTGFGLSMSGSTKFTAKVLDDVSALASFGYSLAVGHFSPGTYDGIAVGEPNRTIGSLQKAGRVVVVNGGVDDVNYDTSIVITQNMIGDVVEAFENFGATLGAGFYGGDPDEDLLIGCFAEGLGGEYQGGIHIVNGGSGGLLGNGFLFVAGVPWEESQTGDLFGYAAVVGKFDGTGKGCVAVSAPGRDSNKGAVYILAPWRQPPIGIGCLTSCVLDCQGNIVFSQKPFQEVYIASTTKIMTVLIACERTQLPPSDPRWIPRNEVYWVPAWVVNDIGGSQVPLVEGEWMTLEDLMYTCLYRSGNDAAHAIADLIHGSHGPNISVPAFVAEMNDRAAQMGLYGTEFNNPNGFENEAVGPEIGEHHSTAYDMAVLTRVAMQNDLFEEIASGRTKKIVRHYPSGNVSYQCDNFFTWVLDIGGSGVKGGWTPAARTTGCFSAPGLYGQAVATTFGTPENDPIYATTAMNLMNLGQDNCDGLVLSEVGYSYLNLVRVREGIFAYEDSPYQFGMQTRSLAMDMQIDLFQADATPDPTDAMVTFGRVSSFELAAADPVSFGATGVSGHGDLVITNLGQNIVEVFVRTSLGFDDSRRILPGARWVIPAENGGGSEVTWTLEHSTSLSYFSVEESYEAHVIVGDEPTTDPIYSAVVYRDPHTLNDSIEYRIDWVTGDGAEYRLVEHEAGETTDIPFDSSGPVNTESALLGVSAGPNPFESSTDIRFALGRAAWVDLAIYDVSGRVVRTFGSGERLPGLWSVKWDGRNGAGETVTPGVYFYRLIVDGGPAATGKLMRIR